MDFHRPDADPATAPSPGRRTAPPMPVPRVRWAFPALTGQRTDAADDHGTSTTANSTTNNNSASNNSNSASNNNSSNNNDSTSRGEPDDEDAPGHDGDDDLVAVGADLEPSTLVAAYRSGIFPWPHGWGPLPWFSPDPRGVLPLERLQVSKSLRQRLRRSGWEASVDADFDQVIDRCSERPRREGTWISPAMKRAYRELHRLGHAHSVEVWDGSTLVGGLYGVLVGGVFTGESMFHRATDGSKVALVELVHRHAEAGGSLVDVQLVTDHLASLGALPIRRPLFLELVEELRDDDVRLLTDRLPVARLAGIEIRLDANERPATRRPPWLDPQVPAAH